MLLLLAVMVFNDNTVTALLYDVFFLLLEANSGNNVTLFNHLRVVIINATYSKKDTSGNCEVI